MATYKVVDADKLDADLTSVADTIREKIGFSSKFAFPEDYNSGIRSVYDVAYETGSSGGYNMGYTDGFTAGNDEGYSIGYSEGNQAGYNDGYDDGYEEGAKNSFTPPTSGPLDPDEVYKSTRPSDWLPLPTPDDSEAYFLGHLLPDVDNKFFIMISYTGTCTIEFGNYVNGVFTAKETLTPVSGGGFGHTLNYNDYGDQTSDGYRQYIARIKINGTINEISGYHSSFYNKEAPILVDFVCGIALGWFTCAGGSADELRNRTFCLTRYIRFVGNGTFGNGTTMFCGCRKLIALCHERTDVFASYCNYMFMGCNSLVAVTSNIFSQRCTTHNAMFWAASSISKLPNANLKLDSGYHFCYGAKGLVEFDGTYIDTSKASNMYLMFCEANSLSRVKSLNISSATNVGGLFSVCYSLVSVTFAGETTPGGWTINMSDTRLGHTALVKMIESLPTATAAATITITNTPGATELTADEIAIATAKNWTITR